MKRKVLAALLSGCVLVNLTVPQCYAMEAGTENVVENASEVTLESENVYGASTVSTVTYKITTSTSVERIQEYLNQASETKKVVLNFAAGTYSIDDTLFVHSNTTINLDPGTKLVRTGVALKQNLIRSSYYGVDYSITSGEGYKGGYSLCHDITINGNGATIDGGNVKSIKADGNSTGASNIINIGHSTRVKISNIKMKNVCDGHMIELAGCKDSSITGCTFDGSSSKFSAKEDSEDMFEAIQLDICKADWASAFKADSTYCQNIKISNNTIKNYPRAIGNHHAVAGKHNTGITIEKNTISFDSTTIKNKQAILCYGFDSSTITGNQISGYKIGIQTNDSKNVSISSNTVKSAAYNAIYVTEKSTAKTISKNKLTSPKMSGISIDAGSSATTISSNTLSNTGQSAIVISSGTTKEVNKNTISTTKQGSGISVDGGNVTAILENNVTKTKHSGIALAKGSIERIESNTLSSTGVNGIFVSNGKITDKIYKNTISSSGEAGIGLKGGSVPNIKSNSINNSKAMGILCYGASVNNIVSNTINSVGQHGISVTKGTAKNIKSNTIKTPKMKGIVIGGGTVGTVAGNKIVKAKADGIAVSKGKVSKIEKNTIDTPKGNGFFISGGKITSTIYKNTIKNSSKVGIAIKAGSIKKIDSNTLTKPKSVGILCYGGNVTDVVSNTITSSGSHGISVTNGSISKIQSNTIKSSKENGICVSNKKVGSITKNKITSSGANAIYIKGGSVGKIDNNTISKTKLHAISSKSKKDISSISGNKISSHKKCAICLANGGVKKLQNNKISNINQKENQIYSQNGKVEKGYLRIDEVTTKTKKIKGQGNPKAAVETTIAKKVYKSKVSGKGMFTVKIPKQKKGTSIQIKLTDKNGNTISTTAKVK